MDTFITTRKGKLFSLVKAALLLSLLFLPGCSSKQTVFLKNDGSGTAAISINLDSIFLRYIRDIAGGFSRGQTSLQRLQLFDLEKIKKQISDMPSVSLKKITNPSPGKLNVSLTFHQINRIFPVSNIFQFTTAENRKTLIFTLTAENFSVLAEFLGFKKNELLDTFGPQKDAPLSKDEYRGMMEYLFDEYGSKEKIDSVLENSTIQITAAVQGTILSVKRSSSVSASYSGSSVKIKIPLVDALTLVKPIVFTISWK